MDLLPVPFPLLPKREGEERRGEERGGGGVGGRERGKRDGHIQSIRQVLFNRL